MASQMAMRRMTKELELLARGNAAPGISAWPREDNSRIDLLEAEICGATDTPYEGGVFRLEISIPSEYPVKPPRVKFLTPIYHPNIDTEGRICLDTLTMPPKGAWKPSLNISTLLTTIQALMSSPNPDDGLMIEITEEFRRNPALFQKKAREYTNKHACPCDIKSLSGSGQTEQLKTPSGSNDLQVFEGDRNDPDDQETCGRAKNIERAGAIIDGDSDEEIRPTALSRLKKKPRLY